MQEEVSRAKRGFASMDPERQRAIASQGGKAAHQSGHAHEFTAEEARLAGRKGGQIVSRDREHMAAIGAKGGRRVSQDREHMAEIGARGGQRRGQRLTDSTAQALPTRGKVSEQPMEEP
jgi:uncharacterized protein